VVSPVKLAGFVLEDLEILGILWWNACHLGYPVVNKLRYRIGPAFIFFGAPRANHYRFDAKTYINRNLQKNGT
jgi:hypothetical protein